MAEEQVASFVRELGHALLTQYVTTRAAQARQASPTCDSGEVMTVHRVTHWSHKTLFGVVQVSDLFFFCRDFKFILDRPHAKQQPNSICPTEEQLCRLSRKCLPRTGQLRLSTS
jgi:hypothetical protein